MEYHKAAWKCPKCGRWNRVRHPFEKRGLEVTRKARCRCGKSVTITTSSEVVMVPEVRVELVHAEEII